MCKMREESLRFLGRIDVDTVARVVANGREIQPAKCPAHRAVALERQRAQRTRAVEAVRILRPVPNI